MTEETDIIVAELYDKKALFNYDTKEYQLVHVMDWKPTPFPAYTTDWEISRYIESLLLGVPQLPFIITESGIIIVGNERVGYLQAFCKTDGVVLSGLKYLRALQGKSFIDLPSTILRRLNVVAFRTIVLDINVQPDEIAYLRSLYK